MHAIGAQIQAATQLAAGAHVAQTQGVQPGLAVAQVSSGEIGLQVVQLQLLQLTPGIERERAIQLQRIDVIDMQPAQLERAALRAGMQPQLHRVIGQLGVDQPQQQLATVQAGVQVDLGRPVGGIEAEAATAVYALSGQRAGRGIKTHASERELAGRLQTRVAQVQCQHGIQLATGGTARPYRAEQALQPASGKIFQIDLRMTGLIQRRCNTGLRLALLDIHLQGIRQLAHLHAHMGIAERAARRTGHARDTVENPAGALVLQGAIESKPQPSPAHRRNIRLGSLQQQVQPTAGLLADPGGDRLQPDPMEADRLGRKQHIRACRHRPACPQQEAATQQKVA